MLRVSKLILFGFFVMGMGMITGTFIVQAQRINNSGEPEPVSFLPAIFNSGEMTHTVVDVGPINPDDYMYGVEELGAWEKHHWTLLLIESEIITISVAAESSVNATVAVFNSNGDLLIEQNKSGKGYLEEIIQLTVNPDETYTVEVFDENGNSGAYYLTIVGDQVPAVLSSRGILNYGETREDYLPENHRHFWYFNGQMGETISITTTAELDTLILISLYDSQADVLEDEHGNPIEYIEESVIDIVLPETGLYLIWLEEFSYDATDYSLYLSAH